MLFSRRKDKQQEAEESSAVVAPLNARLTPKSPSEAIKPVAALPPPPKISRQRGSFLSKLSGVFTAVLIAGLVGVLGIIVFEREINTPGPLQTDKTVVIPRNSGVNAIADILEREGAIDKPFLFGMAVFMDGKRSKLRAGEYGLKAGASISEIVDVIAEGKAVLHSMTIPEGLTSEQIVIRLKENDILVGEVEAIPQEGTLLPDTYKFERGMTRQQLLQSMQKAQNTVLEQIWGRRASDLPLASKADLVTLASIVEKETGRADERTRVASVFLNRLAKKMKLQSDPTIVYGLAGGKGTLGRGIYRSEINKATPYNTYVIPALPPGPIANPGRAALEAVANPSRTKDLYFVADGTGGHVFAETYEQHQRNVGKWRQIERVRADSAAGAVDRVEPEENGTETEGAANIPPPAMNAFAPSNVPPPSAAPSRQQTETGQPRLRGRAFDASEGTDRDPLRNKTFDLNSPQTVPQLRQP